MLSMKKAPAQAVSGETNAGALEGMCKHSIRSSAVREVPARVISYQKATCQGSIVVYGGPSGLTEGRLSATVKAPNNARRNKRLFCLPRIGKSLVSYSACLAAGGLSIGWLAHIGRVTRLGLREGPAVSHWPGSVLSCLFSFKTPKQCEVSHA